MKLKDKIRSSVNNQRGVTSLTFVFAMMFFFWMVLFMIDIFRLTHVYLDAVSIARRATEVVSAQGGICGTVPKNYPTPTTYINSSDMKTYIFDAMVSNGIEEGDVTIKNLTKGESIVLGSGEDIVIDYGEEIEVILRYKFNFESVPDSFDKSMVFKISRRSGSQYKNRLDDWEGEEIL